MLEHMRSRCSARHNLGTRSRSWLLRRGVLQLGGTLALGFLLVELGVASRFGWLLTLPLAIGCYSLCSALFGVCAFNGFSGMRVADHGSEAVTDTAARQRFMLRGLAVLVFSLTISVAGAKLFLLSV